MTALLVLGLSAAHGQKMQPMTPGDEPDGIAVHGQYLTHSTRHFNGKPFYDFRIEIRPPGSVPKVSTIDKTGNPVTESEWTSLSGSLLLRFKVAPDYVARSEGGITLEYGDGQSNGQLFRLTDYLKNEKGSEQTTAGDAEDRAPEP